MKRVLLSLLAATGLLLAAAPAMAQYSYPGSISNYRTAPPQRGDKAAGVARPNPAAKPAAPNMPNRTGAPAANTDGKPTAKPTLSRTPMATPPGQARAIPGAR